MSSIVPLPLPVVEGWGGMALGLPCHDCTCQQTALKLHLLRILYYLAYLPRPKTGPRSRQPELSLTLLDYETRTVDAHVKSSSQDLPGTLPLQRYDTLKRMLYGIRSDK